MKKQILSSLLSAFIVLHAVVTQAQKKEWQLLDQQLSNYEVQFESLMKQRGLPYLMGTVTGDKIMTAVEKYSREDYEVNPSTALLFYHHHQDTLHTWLLDHQRLLAHAHQRVPADSLITLNNTLKFAMSVDNMLGLAKRSGTSVKNVKKYRMRTNDCNDALSSILFPAPVAEGLRGKDHLIIVPCLNLSGIPYSILKPWRGGGYLIDSLSFSFAHNFTQFFESAENDEENEPGEIVRPLIAGSPDFGDECTRGLTPLPGAAEELHMAARAFATLPLLGPAARKDTIISMMETADLIYLATHGWSDTEDPLSKSFIALWQPGGCGYLTPLEIQKMTLKGKPMVVLSACQSGLGKVHEAGIIGLARAFLKTGARSVTMSLWDVNDSETSRLMQLYVEELRKPHPFNPAEPWRQAVLRYRKEFNNDPLYWAAFQNFGVPYKLQYKVALD